MPHIQFVYDGLGNVTEVIDMVTDITERKLAEKDTANLAAIVQSSDDAIISKTLEGIVTSWNIGAEKVFGYTAEEMIGESITKLIPQERLDEETMILTQIKQGKGIEQFSTIRVTKSGKRIHISLTTSPVKDRKGRVIGASKIARDISAAIEAACKIEESEERLRLAIEATKLGTWDYQPSTGELNWSEECKRIYALPPGLEIDFKIFEEHIYPDDKALALGAVAKAMDPEGEGEYDLEYRIIRFDDNGVRWIRAQGKVFFDDMGQPGRFIGTVVEITEQKQSQIALEESEQRTRLAIEAAKLGTFEWDLVTMDFSGSQRLLNIFGHSERGSLTHKDIMEAFHPDDKPIRDKAVELAREKGELRYEVRVFWPDKSLHWITVYGKMVYDKNHSPLRMYGTVMDVTDEKITRNALEESEQRFKIIANTAPVMIWMSGTDKFADFFNISWLNFTGRTMSQESGDGWLEGVHPDDRPRCVAVYNEAHAKEQAFAIEYRLRNRHGLYRWISDNAVPRVTPEGKFIGFISASRDIDDEKRFNEKLKESELLFKTITNVSPVALWMTDAGGKNNYVNDTWLEWTGMAQERQHDRGWMSSMIEADREGVGRHFNICFEKREVFSAEFRYKRKDAEVRWVYSEGSPYYDIDGVFAGYAGSVVDITERKQDEIRKNEFLAVASHELKTPLTSVKAYAQLLASKYEKTQDAFLNNAVLKIDNQVNKMTKLVGDFLNLAKIESDKFQLNTERFAIMELVKEISYDMQLVSGQHKIVVEQREEVEVVADREKIAQVITNLLNNAVKYSPEDKNILISVGRKNGQAKVSVIDKGIGIKREEQEKIFERFYRSKFNNNISFSGFGIGLYISAEIIRKHSGDIGVESEFGKGATFYFTLPVAN
ncbi:MAG: PAS domain S-box protein [Chitinophagaceae bacterium]|nr:PAS domain S-box protein [Chitinophagaceae bacterium]